MNFSEIVLQVTTNSSSLSSLLSAYLPEAGGGALVGYAGGWLLKKIAKIVFYIIVGVAAFFGGLTYWMESQGWITVTVNWAAIEASLQSSANSALAGASSLIPTLSLFTVSGAIGFLAALRK